MNEKEKKAIKELSRKEIFSSKKTENGYAYMKNIDNEIQIVLNLLEKKDALINTMQAEFKRLENLEDNTDMLKLELEKKDKQINDKKGTINALQNALKERTEERDRKDNVIARQNKIIDEMAGYIATLDIEEDICSKMHNEDCDKMNFGECEDCVKQYFERKVK